MSAAGEICLEEGCNTGLCHVTSNQSRAKRDDICIVVLTCELGRKWVVNPRAAAFKIAVDRNRNANPTAANCNSAIGFPEPDERPELCSKLRIIDAFGSIGPKVSDIVPLGAEPLDKLVFK